MRLGRWAAGVGLFCMLSGGILAVAGYALGAQRSLPIDTPYGPMTMRPFSLQVSGLSRAALEKGEARSAGQEGLDAFQTVEIDLDLGSVRVETGTDYGVEMTWTGKDYELHHSSENGCLRVWSTGEGPGHAGWEVGAQVTVTVPRDAQLDRLDLDLSLGDAELVGLSVKEASLTASLGEITARDCVFLQGLEVRANLGSVDLQGSLDGNARIQADLGDVTCTTSNPKQDYTWDLRVDLGELTIDGKSFRSGQGGSGPHRLEIGADLGSVSVEFGA